MALSLVVRTPTKRNASVGDPNVYTATEKLRGLVKSTFATLNARSGAGCKPVTFTSSRTVYPLAPRWLIIVGRGAGARALVPGVTDPPHPFEPITIIKASARLCFTLFPSNASLVIWYRQ
jgi:hypothetical protein